MFCFHLFITNILFPLSLLRYNAIAWIKTKSSHGTIVTSHKESTDLRSIVLCGASTIIDN